QGFSASYGYRCSVIVLDRAIPAKNLPMRAKARRSSRPHPLPLSAQIPHAILNVDGIPGPQRIAHGLHGGLEVVCVQGFEPSQVAHVGATEFGCRNPDGADLNVVAV